MQNSFINDGYPHPAINRQYIGARYVPKFADPLEWSNVLQYEPLTIVSYMGQTYTSKVPVPVGVPPTNTDFWALTGPRDAQIECMMQKIKVMEDELSRMSTLSFRNKSVLVLGDQWLTQPSVSDCLISRLSSVWASSKINYVQTTTGGYIQSAAGGDSVADALNQRLIAEPSLLDGVDSIIIATGVNDVVNIFKASTTADITQYPRGVKETLDAIRAKAPEVPIYTLFLGIIKVSRNAPAFDKFLGTMLSQMDQIVRSQTATIKNALYLNGAQVWTHNRLCVPLEDGTETNWYVAPTVTSYGAKDFAEGIVSFFSVGSYEYDRSYTLQHDEGDPDSHLINMQIVAHFSGKELVIYFNPNSTVSVPLAETASPVIINAYLPALAEDGITTGYPIGQIWTSHVSTPSATGTVIPTGYYWRQMDTPTNPFTINILDNGKLQAIPSSKSSNSYATKNPISLANLELVHAQHIRTPILDI